MLYEAALRIRIAFPVHRCPAALGLRGAHLHSIADPDLTQLSQKQWTRKRLELLGFIFQDHQLLPDTRIGDQLELVAKLKGQKDKATRHAEVRSLMEDLGIEASYAKYPHQMSGGQKQRAAIARAFIGNRFFRVECGWRRLGLL